MPEIFLHTARDGTVWGMQPYACPRQVAASAEEYACTHKQADIAKLLSRDSNNTLQYELLCRGAVVRAAGNAVRICPNCSPFQALLQMSSCAQPASLGGWWSCSEIDLHTYRLKYDPLDAVRHPVLSKLPELKNYDALSLLVAAADPRRFIDPVKPFSSSKFKSFVGLRSKSFYDRPHPFLRCLDDWEALKPAESFKCSAELAEFVWRHWLRLTLDLSSHQS